MEQILVKSINHTYVQQLAIWIMVHPAQMNACSS